MTRRSTILLGLAAAGLSLAACATKPPVLPVLTLDSRVCTPAPDLASARPLVLDADKSVTLNLDANASCVEGAGGVKSVYASFRLPESGSEYLVSVTSAPIGQGLFSPQLQLLDSAGKIVREIPRDAFVFHGASLYVGLRIHSDEHYLIVASEPNSIGQQVSQIVGATQVSTAASGGFYFELHSGTETISTHVYALNGSLILVAQPIPVAK